MKWSSANDENATERFVLERLHLPAMRKKCISQLNRNREKESLPPLLLLRQLKWLKLNVEALQVLPVTAAVAAATLLAPPFNDDRQ